MHRRILSFRSQLLILSGGLLLVLLGIWMFLLTFAEVENDSFEPEFFAGDYVLLQRRAGSLVRGSIVLYRHPETDVPLLGEVGGVPGDHIVIEDEHTDSVIIEVDVTPETYFIRTTSADHSLDSRSLGPISEDYIVGAVFAHFPRD